jgi:hypothetical protein
LYSEKTPEYYNLTCPEGIIGKLPKMHKLLEDNLKTMAPKIDRMLSDLRIYLGLDKPIQQNTMVKGQNNVIILCDQPSGLYVLLHMLRVQSIDYICILGQDEKMEWRQNGRSKPLPFTAFESTWEKECRKKLSQMPTRVVVINTQYVAEGVNVLGVDMVLGLSSYPNGNTMEQAYGRADRFCRRLMFRGPGIGADQRSLIRKLYLVRSEGTFPEVQSVQALKEWSGKTATDTTLLNNEAFLDA